MSSTDDLQREIDSSFGDGPPHRAIEDQLATGRRALRRRRVMTTAAGVAVVAALGTGYAVASPHAGRDAGREIAGTSSTPDPTAAATAMPTPASDPSPSAVVTQTPWRDRDLPVRYVAGVLQVRPGTTVHEHLENPFGYRAPSLSDAFDLTFDGQRTWVIIEDARRGGTSTSSTPSNGWASFADWVADQVRAGASTTEKGWPTTMVLTADGRVVAAQGAEVFNRTDHPELGPRFAPTSAVTGAAVVRPYGAEYAYFVVWRVIDGQLDVITTPPRDTVGATFQELLTYARGQYDSGEGLR